MRYPFPLMRARDECTPQELIFAAELVATHNGAAAARAAGYSPDRAKNAAWELLQRPRVRAEVARQSELATAEAQAHAAEVLRELRIILNSSVEHFTIDEHGDVQLKPDVPADAWRAVSTLKRKTRTYTDKTGETVTQHEVELKFWSKTEAARLMGDTIALYRGAPAAVALNVSVNANDARERIAGRIAGIAERIGARDDSERTDAGRN